MSKQHLLIDGEAMNRECPDTFSLLSLRERSELRPGDFAKLGFQRPPRSTAFPAAERMWVRITERTERGYVGTLSNRPAFLRGLTFGERVEFQARHVLDIQQEV